MPERPNKSVLDMLAAIQFSKTDYEGNEERWSRATTTAALPWCFVHTLNYSVVSHSVLGGVKINKSNSIWCGHVTLEVFDKRRHWEDTNEVVITLVQVGNHADEGDWRESYSVHQPATMETRTHCDASAVADPVPEFEGREMLSAVADDILKYGSRLLVGYFGHAWGDLPQLLTSCKPSWVRIACANTSTWGLLKDWCRSRCLPSSSGPTMP